MDERKKQLRQRRMMQYFMDAAQEIIETEGIEAVTIRKVSDKAGYNSATMYNYFADVEQLISFTLLDIVMEYFEAIGRLIAENHPSYLRFLLTWKIYAVFSFEKPEIYTHVFFSEKTDTILGSIDDYLAVFPSDIMEPGDETYQKIMGKSVRERDDRIFDPCIQDGYVQKKDRDYLFTFYYALYLGLCKQMKLGMSMDRQRNIELFVEYCIDFLLSHSTIPENKEHLQQIVMDYPVK